LRKSYDGNDKVVYLEPSLPFIYAPAKDWDDIIGLFRAGSIKYNIPSPICEQNDLGVDVYCYWPTSCKELAK